MPAVTINTNANCDRIRVKFLRLLFMRFILLHQSALSAVAFSRTVRDRAHNRRRPNATSAEEHWARARSVNLHVTGSAVAVLRVLVMLWPGRFLGADIMGHAVARQAQLVDRAKSQ